MPLFVATARHACEAGTARSGAFEGFMQRRYATADVFTDKPLSGNPVAVVLDADGLTVAQMQALAVEFNYIETTFVLPPQNPAHTAHVRIFTPEREVPFAGHPNIGTAFLIARERIASGDPAPVHFAFEEAAGLVHIALMHEAGAVVGAELLAPLPLTRGGKVDAARAAVCLGLSADDVRIDGHAPQVISVGLPFLVFELASRDALRRARPDRRAYDDVLPLDGATSIYVYTRESKLDGKVEAFDLQSRMFTRRMAEDPATGSATAALTALLAELRGVDVRLRVLQGEDMGRPSTLLTRAVHDGQTTRAYVSGRCAAMFEGAFNLS
jgi:trans-2,3-dihydro-3-hydroxyanthranilate isomerase